MLNGWLNCSPGLSLDLGGVGLSERMLQEPGVRASSGSSLGYYTASCHSSVIFPVFILVLLLTSLFSSPPFPRIRPCATTNLSPLLPRILKLAKTRGVKLRKKSPKERKPHNRDISGGSLEIQVYLHSQISTAREEFKKFHEATQSPIKPWPDAIEDCDS